MTIISPADLSSTETKEYDSAYDTLNKSSRCSQQAPTLAAPSDEEESVESSNTERTLTRTDPFYKENVSTCSEHSSAKRHSAYLVIEDKENFDMSIGKSTEGDAEFECEYEVRFLFILNYSSNYDSVKRFIQYSIDVCFLFTPGGSVTQEER